MRGAPCDQTGYVGCDLRAPAKGRLPCELPPCRLDALIVFRFQCLPCSTLCRGSNWVAEVCRHVSTVELGLCRCRRVIVRI